MITISGTCGNLDRLHGLVVSCNGRYAWNPYCSGGHYAVHYSAMFENTDDANRFSEEVGRTEVVEIDRRSRLRTVINRVKYFIKKVSI